jgi:hypothetical protein
MATDTHPLFNPFHILISFGLLRHELERLNQKDIDQVNAHSCEHLYAFLQLLEGMIFVKYI